VSAGPRPWRIFDGLDDLEALPTAARGLVHGGEQVVHLHAHFAADGEETGGELLRGGPRHAFSMKAPEPKFHHRGRGIERLREASCSLCWRQ